MAMRLMGWGACRSLIAGPLIVVASACFDGGDYPGGGRIIEAPGKIDVAQDALDDTTPTDDASPEDGDVSSADDGALADIWLDVPRSEPPIDAEDAGRGEAEGGPIDVTSVDVAPPDVSSDGPPGAADVDPRDAAADAAIRDVPLERRD